MTMEEPASEIFVINGNYGTHTPIDITAVYEIENNTGISYRRLYIVGGGAKNRYLNRLTEEATGKEVVALPVEATALGNLKIQIQDQEETIG